MCTLVIAIGVDGGPELFVIANRDEQLDRRARRPAIVEREDVRMLAPRDLKAGGTWIGLNEAGVVAGITNRFGMEGKEHHRSRGELVFQALGASTARRGADKLSKISPGMYNGFHLTVADCREGFVVWSDTETIRHRRLEPGFHAITERSFEAGPSPRLERMTRRLASIEHWSDTMGQQLRNSMAEHDDEQPLESTCVHLPDHNYGTRSSTIIELGKRWRFLHADGPPCSTEYREYGDELEQLQHRQGPCT